MLDKSDLTPEQQDCIDRLYEHDHTLLVAAMGSGKTVISLTAASELLAEGVFSRLLIVAPLATAQNVWSSEHKKWAHLQHLKVALCLGNVEARIEALAQDAPITVVNFENLPWLLETAPRGAFDALLVDELSRFKAASGVQFKALRRRLRDFSWRVGMTGTPVSEDWTGLYGQMLIVDGGKALGTRKDRFLQTYFYPTDYNQYNWALMPGGEARISKAIRHIVYQMPDYTAELPSISYANITLPMPAGLQKIYDSLKSDMLAELEDADVSAESAAVLTGKLQQCANGFLYHGDDERSASWLSYYKINAVVSYIKQQMRPTLLAYWYQAEYDALTAELDDSGLRWASLKTQQRQQVIKRWNNGELDVLLLHPRSAGHGLNLAQGGADVVWLAPQWSRDLQQQTNARLWRRGQKQPVRITVLMAENSIDYLIAARLDNKSEYEKMFVQHLRQESKTPA